MELDATFWDHVEELRKTLIRSMFTVAAGFIISLLFYKQLFQLLTYPLEIHHEQLVILGPVDGITTTIKTSFWVALVGTSPIWITHLLRFITPALNRKEKLLILPFLLLSAVFLCLGFLFAFAVTIPMANQYLLTFNQGIGVNLWSFSHYLDYTIVLLLGHALAFEIWAALLTLVHFRMVKPEQIKKMRPYMIVGAFILSAILTPPDVLTQVLLAIPLLLLYELAGLYARFRK